MQKILIVEDDLAIQALLHDFIQEAGYEVTLASDGVEALSYFSERSFDLVLLDIMLPKIDGYGVCEVIRRKSNIPIVMLTALDAEENQIKGLDLEADDYNLESTVAHRFTVSTSIRALRRLIYPINSSSRAFSASVRGRSGIRHTSHWITPIFFSIYLIAGISGISDIRCAVSMIEY